MPECAVPGCPIAANNGLGVRIRRPSTAAIWARETGAHLCDQHASGGARLTLVFEATDSDQIQFVTYGASSPVERTTPVPEGGGEDAE